MVAAKPFSEANLPGDGAVRNLLVGRQDLKGLVASLCQQQCQGCKRQQRSDKTNELPHIASKNG